MIGQSYLAPVISNLTLALFHDSGHYFPNYSAAETLLFGRSQGCNFASPGKCVSSWPKHQEGYICDLNDPNRLGCSADRRSQVWCNGAISSLSGIPPQFQYFSDPTKGGSDSLMDFCPVANERRWCLWSSENPNDPFNYGEQYCRDCRCFMSNLIEAVPARPNMNPGCYRHICISPEDLRIQIGEYYYNCPFGGVLEAENFGGELTCPANNDICDNGPYHENWPKFISISPKEASPGDSITITGENFASDIQVVINAPIEKMEVTSTQITGKLASSSQFTNPKWLSGAKASVLMKDSLGRSTVGYGVIRIQVGFSEYLYQIGEWFRRNPVATFFIFFGFAASVGICLFFCIRETRKAKGPLRSHKSNHSVKMEIWRPPNDDSSSI